MVGGCPHLQTTDPRAEVEKVVMDLRKGKQEEEVMVSSKGCQTNETGKGKGKGGGGQETEVTDNKEAKEHHRARGRFRKRRKKSEVRTKC